jgi:hypothetical protein
VLGEEVLVLVQALVEDWVLKPVLVLVQALVVDWVLKPVLERVPKDQVLEYA